MAEPAEKSRRRKKRSHLKIAAAAGILAFVFLNLGACRAEQPTVYEPDPNAAPAAAEGSRSVGELREELQSQADESSFRLQLNAEPTVRGDQAELLLGNPAENKLCLSVSIRLDDNGETLYESGSLVPGEQVLTATLNRALPVGQYHATADCTAIDPETGEVVGTPIQASLLLNAVEPEETAASP